MPKTTVRRKPPSSPPRTRIAPIASSDDVLDTLQRVREVQTLRARYAAAIIAAGVLSEAEVWTDILGTLAEAHPTVTAATQALETFFTADVDQRLPYAVSDRTDAWASDIAAERAFTYGDLGFQLGLAVGMQLGPHAFDGLDDRGHTR